MRLKYKVNVARKQFLIFSLGVLLTAAGLSLPLLLRAWLPAEKGVLSLWVMIILAVCGILLAKYLHETYRFLLAKLLGVKVHLFFFPAPRISFMESLQRWQGVSLTLAPLIDLTLIALIAFYFSSWLIVPLIVAFITVNFIFSARDLVEAYYILRVSEKDDLIQKTNYGFEVWTSKKFDNKSSSS